MKLYTVDNRADFTVKRVELLTFQEDKVLVVYAKEDNQQLEEIVLMKDRSRARWVLKDLMSQLKTYGDSAFWDLWDYTRSTNKF